MVEGVSSPPEIVRCQREHADDTPGPIVREAVVEEGAVAAIVLYHEKTHQKARGRHGKQQATPMAGIESSPDRNPKQGKRPCRDRDLKNAPHAVWLAIVA
jgi:hypothetical protein